MDDRGSVGADGLIHNPLERGAGGCHRKIKQLRHVGIRFPAADAWSIGAGFEFHQ